MSEETIILGSRSPRRQELLSHLISASQIEIVPPLDSAEAGFDELHELAQIRERLISICLTKNEDVFQQVQKTGLSGAILTADTIVVVEPRENSHLVVGQPPAGPEWQETVRHWFLDYYAGKTHRVMTGLCFRKGDQIQTEIAETRVTFCEREQVEAQLEWYLSTAESLGKAGGYAVQGAGSIFVSRIEGSLSNVVGLPLETVYRLIH